ncbi:ABC transporter ATP-binding protein [Companilactobacillus musae]|uniref:ABC transporter ATP-binding protein n=1 Tax=Companilactobacillus musae TaxID=1903258 RepID=UPI000E64E2F6|nr:ABC transporter ATP-binding protein [Companilactobacillus musae]
MLLKVEHLTKKINQKVIVDDINLKIYQGQLIAFLGPNGAGKSTTINMLTGIIKSTTGIVDLQGLKPNDTEYHQKIGVVFQNSVLDQELTVKQNLLSRQRMYKKKSNSLNYWIDKFHLEKICNQKYKYLSGGQKRRVDIARALIHQPQILFLDEPTTGLDIQTRNLIWKILNDLRKDTKLTIVLTTHYLEEAEYADFVYVINHGKIISANTVDNLKKDFAQNILNVTTDDVQGVLKFLVDISYKIQENQIIIPIDEINAIVLLNKIKNNISGFEYRQGNMDDIFVNITGEKVE